MKKTVILTTVLITFLLFSGCGTPSNTKQENDTSNTEQQNDDSKKTSKDTTNPEEEKKEQRKGAFIIIPTPEEATVGEEKTIRYSNVANNYTNDEYEVIIVKNLNYIDVSIEAFSNRIIITGKSAGTIIFKVHNKTADCTSNDVEITFKEKIQEPVITETSFVGTWTTNYNNVLIDTIEFYSGGTGKCYNSKYPGSGDNTFKWVIRDTSTLKIWNSLNMEGLCTYNLNVNELTLTNFLGIPKDTPVLFTKSF